MREHRSPAALNRNWACIVSIPKRFLSFFCILAIGTLAFLPQCRRTSTTGTAAVKAKLAILTWVGYGPFFVAKEKRFFEKHGVDIAIVKIEELGARHSALISGSVQLSITSLDLFAIEASQGLPAVCFLKLDESHGGDGIVARREIRSIKDLQRKKVAFEKGTASHFFLHHLLEKEGLAPRDITPVYMTAGDAGAAFVAGRVDAAVTWEPWLGKAEATPFGHILVTTRDNPGLIADVLLVHTKFAKDHPEAVEGVIRAWFDAVAYCGSNRQDAEAIMAKGLGLSPAELAGMLKGVRFAGQKENATYFGLPASPDAPVCRVFKQAQSIWRREGLINRVAEPDDAINRSFLLRIAG